MKTATTMKISKRTLDILKNFSAISENIYIPAGNKLYTIGKSNGVVAEAIIDETFDSPICIYELMSFLGVVSLLIRQSLSLIQNLLPFTATTMEK